MSLSVNSGQGQCIPLTGERNTSKDSVMIAYDDLRLANSKLVELKHEKMLNALYRNVIKNDSTIINNYYDVTTKLNNDCKRAIKQRNIAIGGGVLVTVIAAILLLVK